MIMTKHTVSAAILSGMISLAILPAACTHTDRPITAFAPAEIRAWDECHRFVKKHLEVQSSAQFPLITNPQVAVALLAPNQWLVQGYVDVRDDDDNGARLRAWFLCQVDFQPGTLTVQRISIGDPEQLDI
jgi:hypothetical protein